MSDKPRSKRMAALEDMLKRLAFIQTAKGYNTDAGVYVLEGEAPQFGESDPDAALAVFVGDDSPTILGGTVRTQIPIEIWACVPVRLGSPLMKVEELIADIRTAVEIEKDGSTDRSLGVWDGGPATMPTGLDRGPTRPLRREPGTTFVGASVEYVARFETRWGQP